MARALPARPPAGPGPARPRSGAAAAAAAGLCGALEVRVGLGHAPPGQRDAPGEQMGLHRLPAREASSLAATSSAYRSKAGECSPRRTWPRRGRGWRASPRVERRPALGTSRRRLAGPLSGVDRVAGGQGGGGGREEQFRLLVRYPALRGQSAERGIGLLRRFRGQPGGQQCRAAVDGQIGELSRQARRNDSCLVEVSERLGKVAADKRYPSDVVPGLGVLEFLPVGGEHLLGPGVVRGRAPGQAEPDEDRGSMGQRPGLPYRVACPAEVGQSAAQVLVCLVETAQIYEGRRRAA